MFASWLMFLLLMVFSKTKEAKKPRKIQRVTPCGCKFHGKLYDLSKLARSNGSARFTIPSAEKNNSFYSYNPCIPFTIGSNISEYHCNNVAICYWSKDGQRRDPLGYQHPGQIHCELSDEDNVSLVYNQGGQGRPLHYTATVEMICDRKRKYPNEATMSLKQGHTGALPVFQIVHQCCCPEGCEGCSIPEPSAMIYYEIGTAVAGVLFSLAAGLVGFMIAKKKYYGHDIPPPERNRYGAVNQQGRRGSRDARVDGDRVLGNRVDGGHNVGGRIGEGGSGGDGSGGGGGRNIGGASREGHGVDEESYDSYTDSDCNVSNSSIDIRFGTPVSDDTSRSVIPSENEDFTSCT